MRGEAMQEAHRRAVQAQDAARTRVAREEVEARTEAESRSRELTEALARRLLDQG